MPPPLSTAPVFSARRTSRGSRSSKPAGWMGSACKVEGEEGVMIGLEWMNARDGDKKREVGLFDFYDLVNDLVGASCDK
jgi:hypothetical protein